MSKKVKTIISAIILIILALSFVIPVHNKVISRSTIRVDKPYPQQISSALVTLDYKGPQEDWDNDNINYGKIKNFIAYYFSDDDDSGGNDIRNKSLHLNKHILEDRKPLLPIYQYYPYTEHTYKVIRIQHKTIWGNTWYTRTNTNHNTSKVVKDYDDNLEIDITVNGEYKGQVWSGDYILRPGYGHTKDQYVLVHS